jgi:hypothetical protein
MNGNGFRDTVMMYRRDMAIQNSVVDKSECIA